MSDFYKRQQGGNIAAMRKEKLDRMTALHQPTRDIMQVCLNGHKITGRYNKYPQNRKSFCEKCGKATIIQCPECQTNIPGTLDYPNVISSDDSKVPDFCPSCGEPYPWSKAEEVEFLAADFGAADVTNLKTDDDLKKIIQSRLDDAGKCLQNKVAMSVIFSCGSAVEGMLFAYAMANTNLYTTSPSAPHKAGKVKPLTEWYLEELINVASATKHINEDTKKFAHALKDFRNYVHPREQLKVGFYPNIGTAEMCYQVTKNIIRDLEKI